MKRWQAWNAGKDKIMDKIQDTATMCARTISACFCADVEKTAEERLIGTVTLPDAGGHPMPYGLYLYFYDNVPCLEAASFDGAESVESRTGEDARVGQCTLSWEKDRMEAWDGREGSYVGVDVTFPAGYAGPFVLEGRADTLGGLPPLMVQLASEIDADSRTWDVYDACIDNGNPVLRHGTQAATDGQVADTGISLSIRETDAYRFLRAELAYGPRRAF